MSPPLPHRLISDWEPLRFESSNDHHQEMSSARQPKVDDALWLSTTRNPALLGSTMFDSEMPRSEPEKVAAKEPANKDSGGTKRNKKGGKENVDKGKSTRPASTGKSPANVKFPEKSDTKPPAAPRPQRLPTPDLDDPPEGMFNSCTPLRGAETSNRQLTKFRKRN
jgi:hypothetical protein